MNTVFLVHDWYDWEEGFEAFETKPQAVARAKEIAQAGCDEGQPLDAVWYEVCDEAEGRYVRRGGEAWIRVEEVSFTAAK